MEEYHSSISTPLFTSKASDMGNFSAVLEAHRGLYQHQLTIYSTGSLAQGTIGIEFLPDREEADQSVDTGKTLVFTGTNSVSAYFTASLRGIMLNVSVTPSGSETLEGFLISAKGPLSMESIDP